MNDFEWQKLKEVVLYILQKTNGLDYYRIFKVLYFAEREHLMLYGTRIVSDDFCALPHGPVPTNLYDAIKNKRVAKRLEDAMKFAGDDASNVLLAKRCPDLDYISKSDKECLDKSIEENANLSFSQLEEKSHDEAWKNANHCQTISPAEMAHAAGASDDIIEYIKEQEQIESILA